MPDEEVVSPILATLSFVALFVAGGSVLALVVPGAQEQREALARIAPWSAFLIAAIAMSGSLYYSESVGFIPCEMCWFQRTAMYPLVVVLLVAAVSRDRESYWYVLPLAAIGLAFSIYHYQLQLFPEQGSACSSGVPCTVRYVEEVGFVSIPFMAGSAFVAILALHVVLFFDARREASLEA